MYYLVCILHSESYSDSYLEVFNDQDSAETYIEKWMKDNGYGDCIWNADKSRATGGDADYFAVAEIIKFSNKSNFLIIEHHAYDGVGFTLDGLTNFYEEAKSILDRVKTNILDNYPDGEVETDDENEFLFDTGDEWLMVEIYENK